jgi:hypothetical protein
MASAPSIREYQQDSEAVAAAASAVKEIGEALEKGTVTSVAFIPTAAVVGAASPASRNWVLVNKTQAARVIASLSLLGGVNPAAGAEIAITLSGNAAVNQGDILEFQSTAVGGTGLADPGGLVRVVVNRGNLTA